MLHCGYDDNGDIKCILGNDSSSADIFNYIDYSSCNGDNIFLYTGADVRYPS